MLDILFFFFSLLDRDIFRLVSFPAVYFTSPQRNNYPRLDCLLMDWYYPAGELGYVASEPTGGSTNGVLRPCPRSALDMSGMDRFPKKAVFGSLGTIGRLLRMCIVLYVSIVPIINIVLLLSFFKSILRFVGTGPGLFLEPKAVVASCVSDECECGLLAPRRVLAAARSGA